MHHRAAVISGSTTFSRARRIRLAALTFTWLAAAGAGAQGPAVPALLGPASASGRVPVAALGRVDTLQARVAAVDFAALTADTLDLELTSRRVVRARLDRRESHRNGAQTWVGHVPGEPLSSVVLVAHDGVLQGSVRTLSGSYSIEPTGDGAEHVVRQVDVDATGVELPPLHPGEMPAASAADAPPSAGDDGSTLDVAVFYTPSARVVAGDSDAAVQTRIALGVSESNTAYSNSGVTPRLRLVGAELVAYTESGNLGTDLARFRQPGDGYLDGVQARRDALGADLMVLVVGNTAGGACGVGYVMTALSTAFEPWAYSVSAYPCISPNYTFAHELGHNMGSAHAPEDGAGQSSLYPYSFGYKHPGNLFRTVMAYNCTSGCPRVLHFSNPNVAYGGAATGTTAQHNNALSLNNAASTIANFRQAVGGGTAPTITPIGNVAMAEDGTSAPIAFTVGDAETPAADLTVTATSANAALVPNTAAALALGGSAASRTLTIRPAANQAGSASITVTVSDGARTASRTFTVTVSAVNDPPSVTRTPAAATIAVGAAAQTAVTVADVDHAGSALTLSTSSSNTTLLPGGNITVALTGTAANSRTYQVTMSPAAGQSGTASVTLTGSDGSGASAATFALTVTVPSPPTIGPVAAQTMAEDGSLAVPFTIGDADTPLAALSVQALSSNTTLVPPAGLVLSGSGASRTLTVAPAANQSGASTITLRVGDGTTTAQTSFALTVSAVNDAPAFAAGVPSAISTITGTATSFPVTVTDVDTAGSGLTLSGASLNTTLLPHAGIVVTPTSSTASSRTFTVTVTPAPDATGSGGLTLTAADLAASVPHAVQLVVTATPGAPDAPTTLTATAARASLNLAWTPATTGAAATSYTVSVGTSPGTTTLPVQTTTGTSLSVSISTSGTYYARVRAVNAQGASAASPEASAAVSTSNGKPGPPKTRVSSSGRTVSIDWDAPTSGDPVTGYSLEVGSAPGLANLAVVPLGLTNSFTATGVPDGTYWLRVRGANAEGTGEASDDTGLIMRAAGGCVGLPRAPVLQSPSVTGSVVRLSWAAPDGGVPLLGYALSAGSAPGWSNLGTLGIGNAAAWSGAAPPGVYHVRVAGRSACGVGPASNDVVVAVGAGVLPGAPGPLRGDVAGRVVSLAWAAPSGSMPASYVVEAGTSSGAADLAVIDTGSPATSISGAVDPGRYYVRVRARAGGMIGTASNEIVLDVR